MKTATEFDFRRGYRLARRIAQGDVAAIRERDALARNGGRELFRGSLAYLNRLGDSDPRSQELRRMLWTLRANLPQCIQAA